MNLRLAIVLWKAILVVLFVGEFNMSLNLKCQKVDKNLTQSLVSQISRTSKHPNHLQYSTYLTGSTIIISLGVIQTIGINPDEGVQDR